jgi:hypothetical protein
MKFGRTMQIVMGIAITALVLSWILARSANASRPAPAPAPETRLICNGQVMPAGWVTIAYKPCASGGTGQLVLNPTGLPKGYLQTVCAQSLIPAGWKEVGQVMDADCRLPGSVPAGNNARRIQKQ